CSSDDVCATEVGANAACVAGCCRTDVAGSLGRCTGPGTSCQTTSQCCVDSDCSDTGVCQACVGANSPCDWNTVCRDGMACFENVWGHPTCQPPGCVGDFDT